MSILATPLAAILSLGDSRLRGRGSVLPTPGLLFAILFTAGVLAGADSARAIRAGCESSIESGTPVLVRGYAAEDAAGLRQTSRASNRRVSLEDVVLSARAGECRLSRVSVFVDVGDSSMPVGLPATLEGEWLRLRAQSPGRHGLDSPGRTGIVVHARVAGP